MATNVGNLNATLSLSAFEFNSGLARSETAAMEFANTVEVQSRRADASLSRMGRGAGISGAAQAVQQIGFGIQDFTSQFETRGLSGGIAAVTNNVQMLGAAFGPVGMAVSALGGALGGILLPRLIETGSIFGRTAEEAERAASRMRAASEEVLAPWRQLEQAKFDILQGTEEQLDKRLETMRFQYRLLARELEFHNQRTNQANAVGNKQAAEDSFKLAKGAADKMAAIQAGGKALSGMRGEVKDAEENRSRDKEMNERTKEMEKFRIESEAAVGKFRMDSLEKFGTEQERLESKHSREMEETWAKWGNAAGAAEARALLEIQQESERKKLEVTTQEKAIAEMGQAAGMSAGSLRNSAAGVSAVNRAVSGTRSDQSVAKEQLKVLKDSYKKLDDIARKETVRLVQLSN